MSAKPEGTETPEFYRRRYFELKANATAGAARPSPPRATENPAIIPADAILVEETIPPLVYWVHALRRGTSLRIANDHASPGVSLLLWNADDTSERYNPADTVKVQWSARLTQGKLLLSDMGRVLASITADTGALHDSLAGGSTPESEARRRGSSGSYRNTRDNFILAAGKLGLSPRDVGPCITFFAPVVTDEKGTLVWRDDSLRQGDYIDLRAEMNLLIALSNCPHPLSPPSREAKAVRATLWTSPEPTTEDYCRTASDEAVRAFQNTDAFFVR